MIFQEDLNRSFLMIDACKIYVFSRLNLAEKIVYLVLQQLKVVVTVKCSMSYFQISVLYRPSTFSF